MAQNDEHRDGATTEEPHRPGEGSDLSRILALSDGVFAFAMTLLVINLAVPSAATLSSLAPNEGTGAQLSQYLWNERIAFAAYALAFFIIGTWWSAHHRLFSLLRGYDRRLVSTNLVFLLFIAITPFDVGLLAEYGDTSVGVGFYAGTQAIAGLVLLLLWLHIRGGGRSLARPGVRDATIREGTVLALIAPVGFGLSVPIGQLSPVLAIALWIGILVARGVIRRSRRFASTPDAE